MDLIQTTALGSGDDVAIDDRRRELHVRQDEELDIPQPCYVHCSKSTTKEHELQKKVKRNEKTNGSNGEATYNDLEPAADDAYLDAQFHNSTEICDDNSIFQKFWSNCRDCCKDNNCTQALGPPFDQYLALCDAESRPRRIRTTENRTHLAETVNSGGRHLCEDRTLYAILDDMACDDFRRSCERNSGGLADVSA